MPGQPHRIKGQVILSCHCMPYFGKPWPQLLDEVWCTKHNDKATVVQTQDMIGNFGWRCECGISHYYGMEKERSEQRALEHHNKHSTRTVTLTDGQGIYLEYKPQVNLFTSTSDNRTLED